MKKKIQTAMLVTLFALMGLKTEAQQRRIPAWVPESGYWVVETNLNNPRIHSVKFYSDENILVGIKEITGTRLNLNKKKVKMELKKSLETSLLAWQRERKKEEIAASGGTK